MPELDGFEVLREVGVERAPAIVFVTAFDQYALRAFDVHASTTSSSRSTDERFRQSLERAKLQVRHGRLGELSQKLAALLGTESRRGPLTRRYLDRTAGQVGRQGDALARGRDRMDRRAGDYVASTSARAGTCCAGR